MSRHFVPLVIAVLALPFAASAQQPPEVSKPVQAAAEADAASGPARTADRPRIDPHCLQHTGTRIQPSKTKQGRCALGPGRVYTSDDINRTGETSVADALRKLDPSIR